MVRGRAWVLLYDFCKIVQELQEALVQMYGLISFVLFDVILLILVQMVEMQGTLHD